MSHTIEALAHRRQKWIDINKENNFEEGIKRLLTELYPDNAHFIYELLQNAEDTCASIVRFTLSENDFEFEHNGERLFDLNDVESITSIGASTKRDDPTRIGKFGVGFKAVFAYTNTPEIHSGSHHFYIKDLVVPVVKGVENSSLAEKGTRFNFPFNHPKKQPRQAVEEVKRGLNALGDNTLLFLNNIRHIEYLLPDGSLNSLERIDHESGHTEIHSCKLNGKKSVSHWLRYQKEVEIIDEDGNTKTCLIAIAYSLQKEDKKKGNSPEWKISPLEHGQVSIYFPAEKETSNLRFHIHAPFASTVARDSVRDCDANYQLRDCIAKLVVDSLKDIRDQRMLTMSFLAVLPNHADNLTPFYEPIREAIIRAFKEEPLTPTRSGSHAPANGLYRGPARIAEIIKDEDLSLLTNHKPPLWAANPPQQNQRDGRFLESLEINSWEWPELSSAFTPCDDEILKSLESWIEQKDDAWVMRFYALLGEACEDYCECIDAEDFHIVRVEGPEGDEHVLPQEAFFPPEEESNPSKDVRFVKHNVFSAGRSKSQKKFATLFLEQIGVRPFDAKTIIGLRLKRYDAPPELIDEKHYEDLQYFLAFWKSNPEEVELFKRYSFLVGESSANELFWLKSSQLYIDSPFLKTGLRELEDFHGKKLLWKEYKEKMSESELSDLVRFVETIGVKKELEVESVNVYSNPNFNYLSQDYIKPGVKITNTEIDQDYSIRGLGEFVSKESFSISLLIWLALKKADHRSSKARFRPNRQYPTRESDSQLVVHLKNNSWIPDRCGKFWKPEDITKDELHADFTYDISNDLLIAIDFGKQARLKDEEYSFNNQYAQKLGFESVDRAEKLAKLDKMAFDQGLSLEELLEQHQSSPPKSQISFPSRPVKNPERRQERLSEQFSDAANKEYIKSERSVRITRNTVDPATILRNLYTNNAEQMICQICKEEMPFRKRDGSYYFENKELLTSKYLPKEHEVQYLALCPLCAAKYQEFVKMDEDIMAELKEFILSGEGCEVPITLGDQKTSIRFVESHYQDIKVVLSETD